ncbi:hypothetical protein D5S18_07435 [Nocardia panacis]|uniref:Alpha-1,6-mannosyltransferase n=1 Tax=Nocardia panacis TaxID=2340916 RepID=A0A3A4L4X7_9NOCA|nr:polyprenol phosphomannose-dependent alpha 1,6 mannosyltransferase MptB [Nocardia panacis]RJO77571.1 hypothetical protein D5S18_07435 [Nocardia panacis]
MTSVDTQVGRIRLFGATGSVLVAIGALGAGAQPVLQDPTQGVRFLSLFARAPISAMTMCLLGMAMIVAGWLLLGRFLDRIDRGSLLAIFGLWAGPLVVAPPLFSQDIYSYLAQGEIFARGLDPYTLGPGPGLGIDNVLTRAVPTIWRDTPAPYGPLFLSLARCISEATGDDILASILLHRVAALLGIALIIWAVPQLARRGGVSESLALWVGVLNPLVLFHLVAGVHNESLMIGLMLAGVAIALAALDGGRPFWGLLVGGCALIGLAAMVKIPALAALGFVGLALARYWGRGVWGVFGSVAVTGVVAGVVLLAVSGVSGLGFGWVRTLDTATVVRSWLSPTTALGMGVGFGGVLLGIGDHTTSLLGFTRPLGEAVAGGVSLWMLLSVYRGRISCVGGLGVSLACVVVLFPVMHPWYLLWAIPLLGAWVGGGVWLRWIVGVSTVFSFLQITSGSEYQSPYAIAFASFAAASVGFLLMFVTRSFLPWVVRDPGGSVVDATEEEFRAAA